MVVSFRILVCIFGMSVHYNSKRYNAIQKFEYAQSFPLNPEAMQNVLSLSLPVLYSKFTWDSALRCRFAKITLKLVLVSSDACALLSAVLRTWFQLPIFWCFLGMCHCVLWALLVSSHENVCFSFNICLYLKSYTISKDIKCAVRVSQFQWILKPLKLQDCSHLPEKNNFNGIKIIHQYSYQRKVLPEKRRQKGFMKQKGQKGDFPKIQTTQKMFQTKVRITAKKYK